MKQAPALSRRQGGFGLLEIIIAAAIIAGLSVAVFSRANKAQYASSLTQTFDDVSLIAANIKARLNALSPGNYSALGTTKTSFAGLAIANLPDNMPVTKDATTGAITAVSNRFGGLFTVTSANVDGGTNNAVQFYLTEVPKEVCKDLLTQAAPAFNTVTFYKDGGTTATAIRANNGPIPAANVITDACDAAATKFNVDLVVR